MSPLLGNFLVVLPHLLSHSLCSAFKVGNIDGCCTMVGVPIKYLNIKFKRKATIIRFSDVPAPVFLSLFLLFIKRDRPFLHLPYSVFERDGPRDSYANPFFLLVDKQLGKVIYALCILPVADTELCELCI